MDELRLLFYRLKLSSFLVYKKIQLTFLNLNKFKISIRKHKCEKGSVIYMVDGNVHHGGLADRLKGIVSLYAYAKKSELDFFIYFKHPFNLNHFLKPNQVKWEIELDNIKILKNSISIQTSYRGHLTSIDKSKNNLVYNFGGGYLEEFNAQFNTDYNFQKLFNELFLKTQYLEDLLKVNNGMANKYIGVSFRFQNLFGDFYEGKRISKNVLSEDERKLLLAKCIETLKLIKKKNPTMNLLVTSDSKYFESSICNIPMVFVNEGKVLHIDHSQNEDIQNFKKSFVDLFRLSEANSIIRVSGLGIYESGFPYLASLIGNKNFTCVELK